MSTPTSPVETRYAGFATVTARCCRREDDVVFSVAVPCESTVAAGLVIAPALRVGADGRPCFRGGFLLVHEPSGWALVGGADLPVGSLHVMAAELAGSGLDWTRPGAQLAEDPDAQAAVFAAVRTAQDAYLAEVC